MLIYDWFFLPITVLTFKLYMYR